MAVYYWNPAGATTWAGTAWATTYNGAPATKTFAATDEAVFTGYNNSNCTQGTAATVLGVDFTGGSSGQGNYTGTISSTGTFAVATGQANGYFKLNASMTYSATGTVTFGATSGSTVFTTAGLTPAISVTVNGVGGTVTLSANSAIGTGNTLTMTNGSFDINGKTFSCGRLAGSGTATRAMKDIATGGTFSVTGNAATVVNIASTTGISWSGFPSVNLTYSGATGTRTIACGNTAGTITNTPSIKVSAGTDTLTHTASNKMVNLDYTGFAGTVSNIAITVYGNLTLEGGATYTAGSNATTMAATSGTKTITSDAETVDFPIILAGVGGTFQLADDLTLGVTRALTLTNGIFDINGKNCSLGNFWSNNANTRSFKDVATGGTISITGNNGNVWLTTDTTNLTTTTLPIVNFTYAGSTGSRAITNFNTSLGFSMDITAGTDAVSIGGTFGAFDTTLFSGWTGTSLTLTTMACTSWDISGISVTTLAGSTVTSCSGNVTGKTGITNNYTGEMTMTATSGTKTITSSTMTWRRLTINGAGGTFQLADTFTTATDGVIMMTAGIFDINGQACSTGSLASTGSTARSLRDVATGGSFSVIGNGIAVISMATLTGLTYTTFPEINLTYAGSTGTRTITCGNVAGTETDCPSITISAGTDIVAYTASSKVKNMDYTGFGGTVSNIAYTVYGNLTIEGGATYSAGANAITMGATSGTKTITSDAETLDFAITINGTGGTFQLADNLTLGVTRTLTITNGFFDINGKACSVGILAFATGTRTLGDVATGGSFSVTGNNATVISCATLTNTTYTTFPEINLTYAGATGTRTIACGNTAGTETNCPSIHISAGTDIVANTATSKIKDLSYAGFGGTITFGSTNVYGNLNLGTGVTFTPGTSNFNMFATSGTKTVTSNGTILPLNIVFNGIGGTWQLVDEFETTVDKQLTLTNGIFDINGQICSIGFLANSTNSSRTLADVAGGGTFNIIGSGTTVVNQGTSTLLAFNNFPAYNLTYAGATGTRTINFGTTGGTETICPSVNITAGTDIIAFGSGSKVKNLNFTGFGGTVSNVAYTVYGNLVIEGGATYTAGANAVTMGATSGTKTITSDAETLDFPITINGAGGTFQLADALTLGVTRALTLTNGIFDINGLDCSVGILAFAAGTRSLRDVATGGTFSVTGSGTTVVSCATLTNTTYTTFPVINLTYAGSTGTRTIACGNTAGTETDCPSITISAGTDIILHTASNKVLEMDYTGFAGTVSNIAHTIYGNLILDAAATYTAGANAVTMGATSGTKTINTDGLSLDFPITINGLGGTFQSTADLTLGVTRALTMAAGTFDIDGTNLSVGIIGTSGTSAKALVDIATGGTFSVTGNAATVVSMATLTGITSFLPIRLTYAGSTGTRTVTCGSSAYTEAETPDIYITAGTDILAHTNGNRIKSLVYTGFSGSVPSSQNWLYGDLTLSGTATYTGGSYTVMSATSGTHYITSDGASHEFLVFIQGAAGTIYKCVDAFNPPSPFRLQLGTLDINGQDFSTPYLIMQPLAGAGCIGLADVATGGSITITGANTCWEGSTSVVLTTLPVVQFTGGSFTMIASGDATTDPAINIPNGNTWDTATINSYATTNDLDTNMVTGFTGTLTGSITCGNVDLSATSLSALTASVSASGNCLLKTGVDCTGCTLSMTSTSGTKTIESVGQSIGTLNLWGYGGTATIEQIDDLVVVGTLSTNGGTLDAAGNNLTIGNFEARYAPLVAEIKDVLGGAITVTGTDFQYYGDLIWTNIDTLNFTYSGSNYRTFGIASTFSSGAYSLLDVNITGGTGSISMGNSVYINNLDFTGCTGVLESSMMGNEGPSIWGNLIIPTGMTSAAPMMGGTDHWDFVNTTGTQTLTCGSVMDQTFRVLGGSTVKLLSNITSGGITVDAGIFTCIDGANNYAMTIGGVTGAGGTVTLGSGTHTLTGMETGPGIDTVWDFSGTLSSSTGTLIITNPLSQPYVYFKGHDLAFNNIWFNSASAMSTIYTIEGTNTFADFKDTGTTVHTLQFPDVTTTVTSYTITAAGPTKMIDLIGSGGTWTISDTTGTNIATWVNIYDSTATGGATWNAPGGFDGGGNTGWNFLPGPAMAQAAFLFRMI